MPTTRPTRSRLPEKLLTITDDFGGWSETATKFFDEENGIIPKLLAEAGKETE